MKKLFIALVAIMVLSGTLVAIAQEAACVPDQNKVAEAAMFKARDARLKTVAALKGNDPVAIDRAKIWLGTADPTATGKLVERLSKMFATTSRTNW